MGISSAAKLLQGASGGLSVLVEKVLADIGNGRTDAARDRREPLLALIHNRQDAADEITVIARVLGSALCLLHLEKKEAARALFPYVKFYERTGQVSVAEDTLKKLDNDQPFLGGLIRGEIGNLMHRTWQAPEGERIARCGLSLLNQRRPDAFSSGSFAEVAWLLSMYARAFWARLAWQTGSRDVALDELRKLRATITSKRSSSEQMGPAIDIVKAVVLDLTADCLSLAGRDHEALQVIHGAQSLFESLTERGDSIRRAHVLYVAGKLTQRTEEDPHIPLLLFARAAQLYPDMHPLSLRTINRRARCFISSGDYSAAEKELGELRSKLHNWTIPEDERRYSRAEMHLTDLYMEEQTAQSDRPSERKRAQQRCLQITDQLMSDVSRLPPRLQIQAKLHRGLALVRFGDRPAEGRDLIQEAFEIGTGGVKTPQHVGTPTCAMSAYIAVLLAKAESLMATGNNHDAAIAWHHASIRLVSVHNPFLREWSEVLSRSLASDFTMSLNAKPIPLAQAQEEFRSRYFRHVVQYLEREMGRRPNRDDLARTLDYSGQQISKLARRFNIQLRGSAAPKSQK